MADEPDIPIARPAPAASPILEYARPDSEFVPDPEVESRLDRRASILSVTAPFRDRKQAARYLASSFAHRYAAPTAGDRCFACAGPTRGLLIGTWWFDVPTQPLRFYVDSARVRGRASTTHACCAECAARLDAATTNARRVALAARVMIVAGVGAFLVAVFSIRNDAIQRIAIVSAIVLIVGGFATLGLNRLVARLRLVPRGLRGRVPGWLVFDGWDGAADR